MDFNKITEDIIEKAGGEGNIVSLSHCMTRLRFILKDESKANLDGLKEIESVLGAVFGAGQLQVIMGPNVKTAYNMIMKKYTFSEGKGENGSKQDKPKNFKEYLLFVVNFIAGSVSPMITGLIAGGMLKLFLLITIMIAPSFEATESYSLLNFIADVPFYFMPIFVAYGAARKLGGNPVYAIFVASALIYPGFVELMSTTEATSLFGLPVLALKYSSTMIPALLSTIAVYYLEKFFDKLLPGVLKNVFGGMLTVLSASILAFVVFGPIGTFLGNGIINGLLWLQGPIGPFVVAVLAAILPFMVMTGTHTVLAPFLVQTLADPGYDMYFKPALILYAVAAGGAMLGVGLRSKNKDIRSQAFTVGPTAIFAGITEPAIYGIALKYKKPLIGIMAGGAAGGIVAGLLGARSYVYGKTTIFALPIFMETIVPMFIACMVSIIVALVVSYTLGINEINKKIDEKLKNAENSKSSSDVNTDLLAIVNGKNFPLSEVNDEVFSKKIMGDGLAFIAEGTQVVAPCSGTLTTVFPGGHAYGITRDDGVEILIHIGIDTVSLKGKGFNVKVEQGSKVKQGEELVTLDLDYLKTTGLDLSIVMIVINSNDKVVEFKGYGNVLIGKSPVANIK